MNRRAHLAEHLPNGGGGRTDRGGDRGIRLNCWGLSANAATPRSGRASTSGRARSTGGSGSDAQGPFPIIGFSARSGRIPVGPLPNSKGIRLALAVACRARRSILPRGLAETSKTGLDRQPTEAGHQVLREVQESTNCIDAKETCVVCNVKFRLVEEVSGTKLVAWIKSAMEQRQAWRGAGVPSAAGARAGQEMPLGASFRM